MVLLIFVAFVCLNFFFSPSACTQIEGWFFFLKLSVQVYVTVIKFIFEEFYTFTVVSSNIKKKNISHWKLFSLQIGTSALLWNRAWPNNDNIITSLQQVLEYVDDTGLAAMQKKYDTTS